MNTDYQRDAAMAVLFKEEVDKAKRHSASTSLVPSYAGSTELKLLDRLARRYCTTQLTGMTQAAFLQLCGLAP